MIADKISPCPACGESIRHRGSVKRANTRHGRGQGLFKDFAAGPVDLHLSLARYARNREFFRALGFGPPAAKIIHRSGGPRVSFPSRGHRRGGIFSADWSASPEWFPGSFGATRGVTPFRSSRVSARPVCRELFDHGGT